MNVHRTRIFAAFAALTLSVGSTTAGGTPAGLGGFVWRSATPQSNTLHGVSAPLPGSGGVGLAATGDASTLLFRRAPLGTGAAGWLCGRGRAVSPDVQYRGVSTMQSPNRVAVAANDGTVLIGIDCFLATLPISVHAVNAVAWATSATLRRLAIVGDSGTAFTYDDLTGKTTAAQVDSPPGGPVDLFALAFPGTGLIGYAAGDVSGTSGPKGALFKSVDGGQTWSYLPETPPADAFLDVFFVSPATGFALGTASGAGVVYSTQDGGTTWRPLASVDQSMRAIAAFDPQRIVLVGGAGILVATDGHTFLPREEPIAGLTTPLALEDVDTSGSEAWAVGEGGLVLASYDMGNTWTTFGDTGVLDQASLQNLTALRYVSDTTVVAAGANGAVLLSQNGGETYSAAQGVGSDAIYALGAPGARNAGIGANSTGPVLAVGARRTVALLEPAAGVASLVGRIPAVDYHAVAMFRAPAGVKAWAVGQGGTIVFSDADSPVWTRQSSGVSQSLNAVQVLDTGAPSFHVLCCGDGGAILRSTTGMQWGPAVSGGSITPLPAPFTLTDLRGVAFRTPAQGLVVGAAGVVAMTVDGGRNWSVQQPVSGASLLALSALPASFSALDAWAVGDHQTVLRSTNGGQSWQVLPPPVPGSAGLPPPDFAYRAVQVIAPGAAFIAGDEGHLLFTANGGSAWTELGSTKVDTYNALKMETPSAGIAAVGSILTGPRVDVTSDAWHTAGAAALPLQPPPIYGADQLGGQAIVVGAGGFIVRSFDLSGLSPPGFVPEDGGIRAVASPQAGQYVAVGDGGLLMRSADSGSTWQRIPFVNPFGPDVQLNAVSFAAPDATGISLGLAAGGTPGGSAPVLLRTTDSGQTWEAVDPALGQEGATINGVAMFSNRVIAAAANGAVFMFNGQAWSAEHPIPGFSGGWNTVSATDGRWYVAGDRGRFVRFPDTLGASAWGALNTGTANDILSLAGPPYPAGSGAGWGGDIESLRDDIRGFTGDLGTMLSTDTGGQALYGDVSGDLVVSTADVVAVLRVVGGLDMPTPEVYFFGDVEPAGPSPSALPGDGLLELRDAARIIRLMMGL